MLKSRFLTSLRSRFAKEPEVEAELEAIQESATDAPEIAAFPPVSAAELPDEPDDLAPVEKAEISDVDEAALMESIAAKVQVVAPPTPEDSSELSAEEEALFDAIDSDAVTELLLALETVDVNQPCGPHKLTPLAHALTSPDVSVDMVIALLEAGADVTVETPMGGNALTAMTLGDYSHWSGVEVFEVCKAFVALGADIAAPDHDHLTQLHRAILRKNVIVLEALLRLDADPNAVIDAEAHPAFLAGMPPLHAAILDPELVALLLNYGADPDQVDGKGDRAADCAAAMLEEGAPEEEAVALSRTLELLSLGRAA